MKITGEDDDKYVIHILIPTTYTLKKLDIFLRNIWLECCSHLSKFIIDETSYQCDGLTSDNETENEQTMHHKLKNILEHTMVFKHKYDMGDTTTLVIEVIKKIKSNNNKIKLVSRNIEPKIRCCSCRKYNSKKICLICGEKICIECSKEHECDYGFN